MEKQHTGSEDSVVMYIPAMPCTTMNAAYIQRQKESFLKGVAPPDFPANVGEASCVGVAKEEDIVDPLAKRAMGFTIESAA